MERFMREEALASAAARRSARGSARRRTSPVIDADGRCVERHLLERRRAPAVIVPGHRDAPEQHDGGDDLNPLGFHLHARRRRIPSMMSPTVLLRDGEIEMALGSAGSNRIRSAIMQTLLGVVDHGLSARRRRSSAPRVHFEYGVVEAEPGRRRGRARRARARRLDDAALVGERNLYFGGVQAVARDPDTGELTGGGDPRRGGVAVALE